MKGGNAGSVWEQCWPNSKPLFSFCSKALGKTMFALKSVVGLTICLPSLINARAVDFSPKSKLILMLSVIHEFSLFHH